MMSFLILFHSFTTDQFLSQFISAKVFQNLYSNKPGSSTLSFCNHAKSGLGGNNVYYHA